VRLEVSGPFGRSDVSQQTIQVTSTGTEAATLSTLRLFPNPAHGMLTLTLPDDFSGKGEIHFANTLGETVLQFDLKSAQRTQKLDIGALPAGMYHVELQGEGYRSAGTLVVY